MHPLHFPYRFHTQVGPLKTAIWFAERWESNRFRLNGLAVTNVDAKAHGRVLCRSLLEFS